MDGLSGSKKQQQRFNVINKMLGRLIQTFHIIIAVLKDTLIDIRQVNSKKTVY